MKGESRHPSLPLVIIDNKILSKSEIVGYVDLGKEYVYVCFYNNKLVVAEHNTFDSIVTRHVENIIRHKYYYAFKILCAGNATVVVRCTAREIILVGVIVGHLVDGTRCWRPASDIETWPGLKE